MRKITAIAASAAVLAALAGCSAPAATPSATSSKPFTIVFDSGLSGALQVPANAALDAVKVAAASLNKTGGILGRKVEVTGLDSTGDPTRAVSVLQDYIGQHGNPDYVIPGVSSGETLALLPLLTRDSIPSSANTSNALLNNPAMYPYHFGNVPTAAGQLAGLLPFLKAHKVTKLTALLGQDAYGQGNVAAVTEALKGTGVTVDFESFDPAAVDLSAAYDKAVATKPQAIYLDCFGASCGPLFAAREKSGATNILTIGGSGVSGTGDGPTSFTDAAALKNFYMGLFAVQVYHAPGDRSVAFDAFYKAFSKQEGGTVKASILPAAIAYDGVRAFAAAAAKAKSVSAPKVAKALESYTPAKNYLVSYPDGFGYSSTSHFPAGNAKDFSYVLAGPAKDGMFQVGTN
jgi:branched-chain amino acid transport system substrate-binding protein